MTPLSTRDVLPRGASARLVSRVATLVLSLATGTPLRSVPNLIPHAGEQACPYLGL